MRGQSYQITGACAIKSIGIHAYLNHLLLISIVVLTIMVDIVKSMSEKTIMIYKESAMKVRQNLGEFINKVQYRHDAIVITKADKPVAVIIDIELFEKIRKMKLEFERLTAKFAKAYQGVDLDVAEAEINEAITALKGPHKEKS
jgi:prevent-host-death family protein